jgi:hypothetical protein
MCITPIILCAISIYSYNFLWKKLTAFSTYQQLPSLYTIYTHLYTGFTLLRCILLSS